MTKGIVPRLAAGFLVTCILLSGTVAAKARDVSMVTINWAPFYGDTLEEHGFFTALVRAAFRAGGHDAEARFIPWKRALLTVARADEDVLMGAYYNDERAKTYHYSEPIFPVKLVLAAHNRTGLKRYETLRDLAGYRFATGLGWYYGEEFEQADYLMKEVAADQIQSIKKLFGQRADIVAGSEVVIRYEIDRDPNFDINDVTFLKPDLTYENLFILTSRDLPDGATLIEDFNRGLAIIRSNGEFEAILRRFQVSS